MPGCWLSMLGVEAQQHHFVYNERMKTESITQAISDLSLKFGENDDQEETLIVFFCDSWIVEPSIWRCLAHRGRG